MKDYPPETKNDFNTHDLLLEEAISKPDLSIIESKDPSLIGGFKIIYNKEIPIDLKMKTEKGLKDVASFEKIRFKLLSNSINKEDTTTHLKVKLELSWENDLLFHYTNIVDEQEFCNIKNQSNLSINFAQYPNLIKKICENCLNAPDIFICTFTINKDGTSQLYFGKETDFKLVDLLFLEFNHSSDKEIQQHTLYRFAYLKSKLEYKKKAIKAAGDTIFEYNPDVINSILESNDSYHLDIDKYFSHK